MSRQIIINSSFREVRASLLEDNNLQEIFFERDTYHKIAGNVYRGRVHDVLPGMQAAFIDIGIQKNAFIHINDLYPILSGEQKTKLKQKELNIKHVLQPGQWLLVQVVKEPIGTKGAKVTTKVSLPGRFFVYLPSEKKIGISRRISERDERDRLKNIANELHQGRGGLIIRTNALNKEKQELVEDYHYLYKTWQNIWNNYHRINKIKLLYKEEDLLKKLIRDYLDDRVDKIVIDDRNDYQRLLDLAANFAPELKNRISLYERRIPIFSAYNIEKEISSLLKRRVWLKSGGYIIIDKTEALVSIDVNTGKFTGRKNLQHTIVKTNKEAAVEIARQLRLRDIGGIIIIDFIDMKSKSDQNEVISMFDEELAKDRTRTSILGLTGLGLLEMTRKKVREGYGSLMQKDCPYCEGTGSVLSESTVAMQIIRKLNESTARENFSAVALELHPEVAAVLIGAGGEKLAELEDEFGLDIYISGNAELKHEDINMNKGTREEVAPPGALVKQDDVFQVKIEEEHASNPNAGIARMDGFIIIVNGAGHLVGEEIKIKIDDTHRTYATAHLETS